MARLYKIIILLLQLSLAAAETLPFTVTGFLDSASANSGSALNRGGKVSISGFTITIPDNLLVEFPALIIPFAEFVNGLHPGPNEVSINGNIVNGEIIAGQMTCSQLDLAFATGVISKLGDDGKITLASGPVLRINDPRAVYSAGYTAVPFFTADDENPSITTFSGFPVCIPRGSSDSKCPQSNRPTGVTSFNVPNALQMVPMRVGDFIEYSGIQYNGETICYNIVVNIDVTTSGSQPGFVRVEDAIIGVSDAGANVEAARHRFVGLASRGDLAVSIYAIDENPCSGEETERFLGTATLKPSQRNKWELDLAKNTNIGKYTRNYRIKIGDNIVETADGIRAGQYIQPVTEWIFPELVTPGGTPPPLDFSRIGPLADGFGPIDGTLFQQLKPWPGASAPAPSVSICAEPPPPVTSSSVAAGSDDTSTAVTSPAVSGTPATPIASPPASTTTTPPAKVSIVANAGVDQRVLGGVSVALSARQTLPNIDPASLKYSWTQIAGSTAGITLAGASTSALTFAVPVVAVGGAPVAREFRVLITHTASGSTSNDTVVVTSDRSSSDNKAINGLTWANRQSGTATAQASTDLVDTSGSMRILFGSGTTAIERAMTRVSTGNGRATYTFSARSIPTYAVAEVRSYISTVRAPGPVVTSTVVSPG